MIDKILSIIDSCTRYEQLEPTCRKWVNLVVSDHSDRLACLGAIDLKIKQLSKHGWSKITGDNRFPCDDEMPEHKLSQN